MALSSLFPDPDELRSLFPPGNWERGGAYFRVGKVVTADFNAAQGLATGRVRGSGGRRYQCLVQGVKIRRLLAGGSGKAQDFDVSARSRAAFITPEDQRILALIRAGRSGDQMQETLLLEETGADVLRAISVTGRGHWESTDGPVLRWAGPRTGRLVWRLRDDARLHVMVDSDDPGLELIPLTPPWYLDPESGDCGPLETGLDDQTAALLAAAPAIAPDIAAGLEAVTRERLTGLDLPLPPPPIRRRDESVELVPCLRLSSEDVVASVPRHHRYPDAEPEWANMAVLHFDYGGVMVDPRDTDSILNRVQDGVLVESVRDTATETARVQALSALGFVSMSNPEGAGGLRFELADDGSWLAFMEQDAPRLRAGGWRIEVDPDFRFRVAQVGDWEMEVAEQEGGHWLDLALGVEVDGERLDLLPLLVDLIQRYDIDISTRTLAGLNDEDSLPIGLDDGRVIAMPVERLRPILSTLIELYDPEQPLSGSGRLRLPRTQAARLVELEEADPKLAWSGGESARDWGRRLQGFQGLQEVSPPVSLCAELRPYQRQGLDWLQFLREFELGGILADDMGLGKTVQTLAHLLVEKERGRADLPSLMVAPTTLMFNWRREAERFAPSLRVLVLQGPDRRKGFRAIGDQDLVLTTYPRLPRDLEALSAFDFHLLILDEAQSIKNPRGQAARAARGLNARHRLCLTGTPLENHLGEIWSLLDFLMPGVLADERSFKRLFRTPIERHGDAIRQEQLRRRVAPFLLRRTKEAVAAELPPKTEILREVVLEGDQRDLYETLRLTLHERVRQRPIVPIASARTSPCSSTSCSRRAPWSRRSPSCRRASRRWRTPRSKAAGQSRGPSPPRTWTPCSPR